jgi:hypothetical protein
LYIGRFVGRVEQHPRWVARLVSQEQRRKHHRHVLRVRTTHSEMSLENYN